MNGFNNGMNNGLMGNNYNQNNDFNNPYFNRMNVNNLPHYNIIQVRGQNGADAFQMAPNSKVLLLDETDPLIWFVQTDGAGYKTVTPYSITPYQPAPPIDINALEARIANLEEKINAKSNSGANKQQKRNSGTTSTVTE